MLDRLKKLKPKDLHLTTEGIIMFSKNNTEGWLKNLDDEKMRLVMECARKSKNLQKEK